MARGDGLRVRLQPIEGVTPRDALARTFYFPAALGDFEFSETASHVDYRTVSGGEFSMAAAGPSTARDLRKLNLEVIAPDVLGRDPWLVDYTETFESVHRTVFDVMRWKQPVDFLASIDLTGRAELAMDVTIRSVSRILKHAQGGYRYFSVELSEWRDTSLRRRGADKVAPTLTAQLPTTHKLASGDTAESLARQYYGHPELSVIILSENGIPKFGRSTRLVTSAKLKVGSTVRIPHPGNYVLPLGKPLTITTTVSVSTP